MDRISADFEKIWDNMSTEQQQIYGRRYIDRHVAVADAERLLGNSDVNPVVRAMTHALFSAKPRTRYLVHGGTGGVDRFVVRHFVSFVVYKKSKRKEFLFKTKVPSFDTVVTMRVMCLILHGFLVLTD